MLPRFMTTLILAIAVTLGTQVIAQADAVARPGSILSQSRTSGTRAHKGRQASTSKSKSKSKSKKSTSKSSSTRRTTQSGTTTRTTRTTQPTRTRTTRTTTTSRPTTTRTTRTVRSSHPTRTTRTVYRSQPRGQRVRRTYRSGHTSHTTHTSHHHTHASHARTSHSHTTTHASTSARSGRTHGRATTEPYITGGLGISGFASDAIVDGALPGLGYNVAVGAKGKLFGGELGLNGGGYTFDPGSASADIGLIGISGDFKVQPSISFFEPYVAIGVGGYALQDGVIDETSAGVGLRLGAGADFRFDAVALRISYLYGAYGMGNDSDAYGGDFGAKTETLGANLIVYF